jgi:hypothetical protein
MIKLNWSHNNARQVKNYGSIIEQLECNNNNNNGDNNSNVVQNDNMTISDIKNDTRIIKMPRRLKKHKNSFVFYCSLKKTFQINTSAKFSSKV